MLNTLLTIIDVIFPPPQVIADLRGISKQDILTHYRPHTIQGCAALLPYQTSTVRAAIIAHKFHHYTPAKKLLAAALLHHYRNVDTQSLLFIPIPLSAQRLKARGYNQVTEVLNAAGVPHLPLLIRTKHTLPQTTLARSERFDNVRHAFHPITHPLPPTVRHIVIVDDVITTGATLYAAKAALQTVTPSHISISLLAFAH